MIRNAGKIHAANPEHLLDFNAIRGADLEQKAGTINEFNLEHLDNINNINSFVKEEEIL